MVKPKNKLEALSINEEVGDIVTHWMKSGSAFRPSADLLKLNEFGKKLLPKSYRGLPFEYDIWFTQTSTIPYENGSTQILWERDYTFEFLP